MEVYVVVSGTYDDYGVDAIFTNFNLAEKFALTKVDGKVETWQTDPENPYLDKLKSGFKFYNVDLDEYGNINFCTQADFIDEDFSLFEDKTFWWRGFAKDEKHAVKIAVEKRAETLYHQND